MNNTADKIQELMEYDPIAEAEKLTGQRTGSSLKDPTAALGFIGHIQKGETLKGLLMLQDDTHWGCTFKDLIRIAEEEGFEVVLRDPTVDGDELIIAWNPAGILLYAESYSAGKSINTAKIDYFFEGNEGESYPHIAGGVSRGYEGGKLHIGKDVREGFRHHLNGARACGSFIPQWPATPFLWLLSYSDSKVEGYDYKAISMARIKRLPEHVQRAINPSATE
jgi:hypothetical protein